MRKSSYKRCPHCGQKLTGNPYCCPHCGEGLRTDDTFDTDFSYTDQYSDQEYGTTATYQTKKHKKHRGSSKLQPAEIWLIAGTLALAAGLFIGGLFLGKALGKNSKASTKAEAETTATPAPTAVVTSTPVITPTPEPTPAPTEEPESYFEIHFLNVGQGDATLVLCDGQAMLVDGGTAGNSQLLYAYLENRNIDTLDMVVCTHPHEDHIGGIPGALSYATAKRAMCSFATYESDRFAKFAEKLNGVEIEVPNPGDTFTLGSAVITVLAPYTVDETNLNNCSIVLRIVYGETSFLLMGDAETEEEETVIHSGMNLSCDVVKIGHHGSDTATSEELLQMANPLYAVISVGANNKFGHPMQSTLDRLNEHGITVLRTDYLGHIVCASDGKTVTFSGNDQ